MNIAPTRPTVSADLAHSESGTGLVETALLLPVLVLLLAVAIDFGRAYSASIAVTNAATAGALYGLQSPGDTAGMILAAKLDAPTNLTLLPIAITGCECSDGSSAVANCSATPSCPYNIVNFVEVDTTAAYTPLFPYPGIPTTISLAGKARFRVAQ